MISYLNMKPWHAPQRMPCLSFTRSLVPHDLEHCMYALVLNCPVADGEQARYKRPCGALEHFEMQWFELDTSFGVRDCLGNMLQVPLVNLIAWSCNDVVVPERAICKISLQSETKTYSICLKMYLQCRTVNVLKLIVRDCMQWRTEGSSVPTHAAVIRCCPNTQLGACYYCAVGDC
jgi:hypothetical protein